MQRFYLDHNACTPADPRVVEEFMRAEADHPANPGSLHGSGRRARQRIETAREQCAAVLGVDPAAVHFVSGGTEANNLAVLGKGDPARPVLLAPLEHPSVLAAAEARGCEWWAVDENGHAMLAPPRREPGLLALVHGQSEVGSMQAVFEAGQFANSIGVPLHVDASQTLGRCDLQEVIASAASITLSTHKAGGLRGCSVYIDQERDCRPLLHGGGQENGRRAGTESTALIVATAVAVDLAVAELEQRAARMREACSEFLAALQRCRYRRLTPKHGLPNTLMLKFVDVPGRELLPALDMVGVEASQGSACSAGSPTPPRILQAMGLDDEDARRCVRFSFGSAARKDEAHSAGILVDTCIHRLQQR